MRKVKREREGRIKRKYRKRENEREKRQRERERELKEGKSGIEGEYNGEVMNFGRNREELEVLFKILIKFLIV